MTRRHQAPPQDLRRGSGDESGAAAIELTLLAPALLVILLFVVGLARMANASQQVESVAADAARAVSLQRDVGASGSVAREAARRSLGQAGLSCVSLSVSVDATDYRPGGAVRVAVSCTASLGDVAIAGFPGRRQFDATATVPIESYRARP